MGTVCGQPSDCADTDGCTVNEDCDTASARCVWDPLDSDGDGAAPLACGGDDCNDAAGNIRPGVNDGCNGVDTDCDGTIDEDATCANGGTCVDGSCECGDLTLCGQGPLAQCVDTDTSRTNCGDCGTNCGSGGTCVDGGCTCTAPGAMCTTPGPGGGMSCVDTDTSRQHCGGCNMACTADEYCNGGDCDACGAEGEPCCPIGTAGGGLSSDGCPGGDLICTGERGTSTSVCGCPSPNEICTSGQGDQCVNVMTSTGNCGACGNSCDQGEQCMAGQCVACGQQVGQPCCVIPIGPNTIYTCLSQQVSCNQQTRICE